MEPRVHAPPRRSDGGGGTKRRVMAQARSWQWPAVRARGTGRGGSGRSRSVEASQTARVMMAWLIASVRLQACMPGQGKTVAGSIILAYNLDGLGGDLKLSRDVYVDICLGKITTWDDPRLKAINPHVRLPHDTIALVVRQDSSGTTYAFTNHLSAMGAKWRDQGPGVGRVIAWPSHPMLAPGNEGVAGRIKNSKGAIGYVEYGFAQRAGLPMAWLENKAGQFIQPRGDSGTATLLKVEMPENLRIFFPDPDGKDSYPIVTFSWLLLYKHYDDQPKAAALKQYIKWCLTEGQAFNDALGYIRLAPQVIARAMTAVDSIR